MDKDKILTKSRSENQHKDLFEKEVIKESGYSGSVAAMALTTVFFMVQIFAGKGLNYGLYAIVFSFSAAFHIVKASRMKRTANIVLAAVFTILVLIFSVVHIYRLIMVSSVL